MNRTDMLMAIDIGTTSVKVILFDVEGEERCAAAAKTNEAMPSGQSTAVDADAVWTIIASLIRAAGCNANLSQVRAIGVTSLLCTVLLDRVGRPLGLGTTYADRRAAAEADELKRTLGDADVYRFSGKRIDPEAAACKLLWTGRNEPAKFAAIDKVMSLKDYILLKLTGTAVTDPIHASYTLLSDIDASRWNESFLREIGANPAWFPPIRPCTEAVGALSREVSALTGLPAGIPVANGGPDGSVGCFGAGLVKPGIAVNVIGTTDVFFTQSASRMEDPERRVIVNPHIYEGQWLIGGPMGLSGGTLDLLKKWTDDTNNDIFEIVSSIPPGAEGLLFITALGGERTPHWNPQMRGVMAGIGPEHEKAHLFRAVLEGTSYPIKDVVDILKGMGLDISTVIAAGGGSRLPEWLQIRADLTECPYAAYATTEFSSLGTAFIAGLAAGIFAKGQLPQMRDMTRYEPIPRRSLEYKRLHERYKTMRTWFESFY